MIELPENYIKRMENLLGENSRAFFQTYGNPPVKGIRVNQLKITAEEFAAISPLKLEGGVPWEKNGFYVSGEGLGKTAEHAAGLYYSQEPSAMCAVPELEIGQGERILDLCAAPGGKSTQIAGYMRGSGILFSNEINAKRCEVLRRNIERAGVRNAVTTNCSPEELARAFENYFDKILVDAPCSGEGMFKKEENAIPEWCTENIAACAARQRGILAAADKMLAGGGTLVYSTCTFAPEEDEEQIESFLDERPEYLLVKMKKLYPHEVRGEGHFCAVLQKKEGLRANPQPFVCRADAKILRAFDEWRKGVLNTEFKNLCRFGDGLYSLPEGMPSIGGLHGVKAGVMLGTFKDEKRFEPSHALAMCLRAEEAACLNVDGRSALNYLRGLTADCPDSDNGWRTVNYAGYPLGWCKVVNGVAKNRLPKGLRI